MLMAFTKPIQNTTVMAHPTKGIARSVSKTGTPRLLGIKEDQRPRHSEKITTVLSSLNLGLRRLLFKSSASPITMQAMTVAHPIAGAVGRLSEAITPE
jgi:hypothetical protein